MLGAISFADVLESRSEYQLKAAYIYNFLQFTEFDKGTEAQPKDLIRVCVISNQGIPEGFEQLSTKKALGKEIKIVHLGSKEEFSQCRVLYFVNPVVQDLKTTLKAATELGILTVGEADSFVGSGGMIHFLIKDSKLRFRVDLLKVKEGRLSVSSRILKLAEEVIQ